MEKRLKISDKSLLCFYKISELIAKKNNYNPSEKNRFYQRVKKLLILCLKKKQLNKHITVK